jgi:hypothetical protein
MAGSLAVIGRDVQPPIICQSCGADEMGCQVKRGLGGRLCCDQCDHDLPGVDHGHVDHHVGDER